jgi:DNA-binding NarL/FixJ family response regulator
LTTREWEILGLLATGATNGQIAAALVVSESTIKSHVKRILRKLPAANRAEAVYRYTRMTSERSRVS